MIQFSVLKAKSAGKNSPSSLKWKILISFCSIVMRDKESENKRGGMFFFPSRGLIFMWRHSKRIRNSFLNFTSSRMSRSESVPGNVDLSFAKGDETKANILVEIIVFPSSTSKAFFPFSVSSSMTISLKIVYLCCLFPWKRARRIRRQCA